MTLKYWQKMYLAVLGLFLACLFGGVLGAAQMSCRMSFEAQANEFLTRQHSIGQSLAEDMAAVLSRRPDALGDLCAAHAERLRREGVRLAVGGGDGAIYAAQLNPGILPAPAPGQRSWRVVTEADGSHCIYASTAFDGALEGYWFTASADVEEFYRQWQRTGGLLLGLAAGASVLFAAGLYAVLRRMNRPLQALTVASAAMAEGDYAARAGDAAERRDELGELGRTLDTLAARVGAQLRELEADAASKQALVDDLSHEMRTPLTAIGGYAEYIQRADLSADELMDAAGTISFESRRLLRLSEQLVRLSALNHEEIERETVPLRPLLERVVRTVSPQAAARGRTVTLGPVEADTLYGQPDLLESLFVNLCDNGIKAGGDVTLCAYYNKESIVVAAADTGSGMDSGTLAQLGRPFFRADKARSRTEGGAGLGVALCRAIAAAHDAELRYESRPGQGTRARVVFERRAP